MNEINLVENYFISKYPDKRYRLKNYYKMWWRKSLCNRIYRYANETSENAWITSKIKWIMREEVNNTVFDTEDDYMDCHCDILNSGDTED